MVRCAYRLGLGFATALALLVVVAQAGEVPVDKVPQVILDMVKTRFAEATVTGAGKEKTEKGNEVYEISLEDSTHNNIDVTLTPEGAILLIEQQISRKELPVAVTKTLDEKYPKSRYRIVEKLLDVDGDKETLSSYEVLLVTPKKQMWAVQLDLEGKIILAEEKFEGEED